jgi:membrane-associated phospholipid phosphatase
MAAATAVTIAVYESLGAIIAAAGRAPRDSWILAAEQTLTRGCWPPLAPLALPPAVVDLFSVAYVMYFALPVVLVTALLRRGDIDGARVVFRTLLIAYYLHYALYLVVPAVGPIRAPEVPADVRAQLAAQGGAVTHAVRRAIAAVERTPQDAFPSAHTSVAILVALLARQRRIRGRAAIAALAAAIVGSTVVLGYHYVVDLVAALPVVWAARRLGARLPQPLDRWFASHLKSPPWRSSITSTSG